MFTFVLLPAWGLCFFLLCLTVNRDIFLHSGTFLVNDTLRCLCFHFFLICDASPGFAILGCTAIFSVHLFFCVIIILRFRFAVLLHYDVNILDTHFFFCVVSIFSFGFAVLFGCMTVLTIHFFFCIILSRREGIIPRRLLNVIHCERKDWCATIRFFIPEFCIPFLIRLRSIQYIVFKLLTGYSLSYRFLCRGRKFTHPSFNVLL
mmetsp:Transcript_3960/g.5240  ORF Transcript_3960/g.5240 Transcript_3960/m.5240 type:complete len:205 (+) Transcript_3960:270-884(+)